MFLAQSGVGEGWAGAIFNVFNKILEKINHSEVWGIVLRSPATTTVNFHVKTCFNRSYLGKMSVVLQ